jgi:choline dehydrogenase
VLVLEAGGSDRKPEIKAPAAFPNQFQTALDWNYMSEPEPGLFGRRLFLPRGKVVGGSSSMNAMLYVRGNRSDYDRWESQLGATGWSYDSVLPYFKRHERNAQHSDDFHGTAGEVHVTEKRWLSPHWERFIEAAGTLGIEHNRDYNGATQDGASLFQTTTRDGRRWSAADAFLRPALKLPGVELTSKALARRIVLNGGRAAGVEYERRGKVETAYADREVLLCAGSYASPQLLMLSGIGPPDHLREHGIEPLVELPPVGENLHEHVAAFCTWRSTDPRTLDDATHPKYLAQWLIARKGKLTSTVAEAVIHWRSDSGLPAPDFQIYFAPVYFWEHGFRKTGTPAVTIGPVLQAPVSRGQVRLRSADPADHPRILNNMLCADSEAEALLRAIELIEELVSRRPLSGVLGEQLNPGGAIRDRSERVAWLRATCEHLYHPVGTCRIGVPGEGVVDPSLKVHGVEALRVADASVIPRITSGNTNAPTYMIAERCAASILAKEPRPAPAEGVAAAA